MALFVFHGVLTLEQVAAQSVDRESLASELATVQAALTQVQTNLATTQKALWKKQHNLEYQDPELVALREDITALEKQVIAKRAQLQARLALQPAIKTIEAERKKQFLDLERLRAEEAAIRRELAAMDNAPRGQP